MKLSFESACYNEYEYVLKVDGVVCKIFVNYEEVSREFFEFLLRSIIYKGFLWQGFNVEIAGNEETIDVEKELDRLIATGVWDWKKEVAVRRGVANHMSFDAEQCRREIGYMIGGEK